MKVLVTGAAGFIGSHLTERLFKDGNQVVALDYLKTKLFHVQKVDLVKEKNLEKYFRGIDWVFHLAGASDIVPSIKRPLDYHAANVTATANVLEASRKTGVKRFIYAASSSCYGMPDEIPTPETAEIRPQYPYAFTKWVGEKYCLHWAKVYKLPVVSLRLFNVYGPRIRVSGDYGPVLSTFLPQKLARKPYTIVGDGTQKRDFTFVTDVVDAFLGAARSNVSGEIFNVGTGKPHSVNELIKLLGDGPVVHIPKRPGEPDITHADIRKIKKILGWRPKVSFEEGIKIVLRDLDHWKNAPVWTPVTIKQATQDWFKYLK